MVVLSFVTLVTGLLVTGFTMMFSASSQARLSSVWVVLGAAFIVGGFLSAQMNGGRPYGYNIPIGLDQWKQMAPSPAAAPKPAPKPTPEPGPPMV